MSRRVDVDLRDAGSSHAWPLVATPFVLLGGVPGAGKSTAIRGLRRDVVGVRVLDSEDTRRWLCGRLPAWLPYRVIRPLVHLIHIGTALTLVLGGPGRSGPLLIHDPSTREARRALFAWLARTRGFDPRLVWIEVSEQDALRGQRDRGRVVRPEAFARHWRRSRLITPDEADRWSQVVVTDRRDAAGCLRRIFGPQPPRSGCGTT